MGGVTPIARTRRVSRPFSPEQALLNDWQGRYHVLDLKSVPAPWASLSGAGVPKIWRKQSTSFQNLLPISKKGKNIIDLELGGGPQNASKCFVTLSPSR